MKKKVRERKRSPPAQGKNSKRKKEKGKRTIMNRYIMVPRDMRKEKCSLEKTYDIRCIVRFDEKKRR